MTDTNLVKEISRQPFIESTLRVPLTHFSPIYDDHCDQRCREVEPRPFVRVDADLKPRKAWLLRLIEKSQVLCIRAMGDTP